jgi:hypothetical protein
MSRLDSETAALSTARSVRSVIPQRDPMTPLIAALVNVAREVAPCLQM